MTYQLLSPDSPFLQSVWQLREDVLRKPIGLSLREEDLSGEKNDLIVAAQESSEIVGCLLLRKLNNGGLKLRQMAVASTQQGRGIGTALLEIAEDFALEIGLFFLELHARETAVSFYEKRGFHTEGEPFTEVGIPHFKMTKTL